MHSLSLIFIGDVVGALGRQALTRLVPELRQTYAPDLVIANTENIAHGKDVTPYTLQEIFDAGVNYATGGNHSFASKKSPECDEDATPPLFRPANLLPDTQGVEYQLINIGQKSILLINLLGRVFMDRLVDCPFQAFDAIIQAHTKNPPNAVIVDFHTEATSEKRAFVCYADGQVAAVIGTHTHVPTADAYLSPAGTASISDVGMVGATNSVLGVTAESAIHNFTTAMHYPLELPESGSCTLNAVHVTIDLETGRAMSITPITPEVVI